MAELRIHTSSVTETPEGWRAEFMFSDRPDDPEMAKNMISIRIAVTPKDQFPLVSTLQREALHHARTAIETEMERLARGLVRGS